MKVILASLVAFCIAATLASALKLSSVAVVESAGKPFVGGKFPFPLYKQCNPLWGSDEMGVKGPGERNTICNEGCAMSSTAMALAGLGVTLNGTAVNPGTFNAWLEANKGYYCAAGDCNNLNLTAPERLSFKLPLIGETQKHSYERILDDIYNKSIIHVAHVRHDTHFVLLTGAGKNASERTFSVHDPGFNHSEYPWHNISDIIRYKYNRYPVYKQCNSSWGSDKMGANGQTICAVGCLMSSISAALAGTGIHINGTITPTPATVNAWLRRNHGYDKYSALYESVIPKINPDRVKWPSDGMHLSNDIPFDTIRDWIDRKVPRICIANVMHGQHFVLVTGYRADGDSLVINDSGFNRATYSYSRDVVGWRIFDMW